MSLTLDDNHASYQIRAYKPGFIQINQETYTHSLIVSANNLIDNWAPQTLAELTIEHLRTAAELEPAILLIGTGETLQFPDLEIYGELINAGIGVEVMDTSAACRTYNILTAENRNVVAALIIR
jgi:uncharacterized protein